MHKGDMEIELQPSTLEKDLGVYIDPKLTFSSHCEQKVNKANKILGLICRSYVHLDTVTVKTLFTSLVRPHLEYGNASWCPIYRKDSELLENTQRRATKLAPSIKDLSYTDRLIALGLPSLQKSERRRHRDVQTYTGSTQWSQITSRWTLTPEVEAINTNLRNNEPQRP